jgi:hypothetical protein
MKGNRIVAAAIFLSLTAILSDARDLLGDGNLHSVVATVGHILEQAQYTHQKLDDSMGKQILEGYRKLV